MLVKHLNNLRGILQNVGAGFLVGLHNEQLHLPLGTHINQRALNLRFLGGYLAEAHHFFFMLQQHLTIIQQHDRLPGHQLHL